MRNNNGPATIDPPTFTAAPASVTKASAQIQLARSVLTGITRLPAPIQRLIGGRPSEADGQRLHPQVQTLVRLLNALPGEGLATLSVTDARTVIDREGAILGGTPMPVDVEEIEIPTADAPVRCRLYRPPGRRPAGMVVYYHGGGWVLGSLTSHDATCAFLANHADVSVLAVDYRLAPEHRFPAGVDDALAAFRFAVGHAAQLGVDPTAIAVAGDSAGGNLSAVVAQVTAATSEQAPALQVLIVPVTDLSTKRESYQHFREGFFLTEADMDWYKAHYLADPSQALDPRVSPLLAEDLTGLPPAYVAVAGFDPLRDEGIAYAERLSDAGVPTVLRVHPDVIHPFSVIVGSGQVFRDATLEIAAAIRAGLAHARHDPA